MTALPHPTTALPLTGQPDAGGQPRTAGQPDSGPREGVGFTAAGCPVWVNNAEPWATLHLVTVEHAGERRNTWVYGSPERLIAFARDELRLAVTVECWPALDEQLPPVQLLS